MWDFNCEFIDGDNGEVLEIPYTAHEGFEFEPQYEVFIRVKIGEYGTVTVEDVYGNLKLTYTEHLFPELKYFIETEYLHNRNYTYKEGIIGKLVYKNKK